MGKVKGLSEILKNIKIYSESLRKELVQNVFVATTNVEKKAKQRVPVDTGKLKQSIYHKMDFQRATAQNGATEDYAPYIEFGTGGKVNVPNGFSDLAGKFKGKGNRTINRGPQPFLVPAFLEEKQNLIDSTRKTVRKYSGKR